MLQEPGKGFPFTRSECLQGAGGGLPGERLQAVWSRVRKETEAYSYGKGEILGPIGSKSDIFM